MILLFRASWQGQTWFAVSADAESCRSCSSRRRNRLATSSLSASQRRDRGSDAGTGGHAAGAGGPGTGGQTQGQGPGRPGSYLPGLPQIRTCPSKGIRFVTLRIRCPSHDQVVSRRHAGEARCPRRGSNSLSTTRRPLRSTGSGRAVPPLQGYYEALRLPATHLAALRCLRLAIPSLRPICSSPSA